MNGRFQDEFEKYHVPRLHTDGDAGRTLDYQGDTCTYHSLAVASQSVMDIIDEPED